VVLGDGVTVRRSVIWGGAEVVEDLQDGIMMQDGRWVGVQ